MGKSAKTDNKNDYQVVVIQSGNGEQHVNVGSENIGSNKIDNHDEGGTNGTRLKILKAIQARSSNSFVRAIPLFAKLEISDVDVGDLLELMANEGLIQVEGLGGTTAVGMTLPNDP